MHRIFRKKPRILIRLLVLVFLLPMVISLLLVFDFPSFFPKPIYSPEKKEYRGFKTYSDYQSRFTFLYAEKYDIETDSAISIGKYHYGKEYLNGRIFDDLVHIVPRSKTETGANTFNYAKDFVITYYRNEFYDEDFDLPKIPYRYSKKVIAVKEYPFTNPQGFKGYEVYFTRETTNKTKNEVEEVSEWGPLFIVDMSRANNPQMQIVTAHVFSDPSWEQLGVIKTFVNTLQIN